MSLRPKEVKFLPIWSNLKTELDKIFNCEPGSSVRGMELFSDVYQLCVALPKPYTDQLYQYIGEYFRDRALLCYKVYYLYDFAVDY